jgi:tetratricopeptide (TPR) repeat protein
MTVPPQPPPRPSRSRTSPAVLLVVAVLIGLGVGRFVTAGSTELTVTTPVAAAAGLGDRISQLEQAVATQPDDLASLQALAAAYVDRAAETGDPAFYALARTAADRAQALQPGDPDTLLVDGLLSLALHEFPDALRLGEQARQARPDSATALGVVVDAQVELGRYDEAAETLQAMLDRKPGLPALSRASYLRELSGDVEGAVTAMQQARTAGSSTPYAVAAVTTLLADLLLQQGEVEAAGQAYADALRSSPSLAAARVGAARLQAVGGDVDGAVAALQQLTQEQPTIDGFVLLADLQRARGDAEGADDTAGVVRAVADLQGQAGQVVDLEMSLFEANVGDPARALELARGAHAARPDNVFTTDALAWALFRTGDQAGADAQTERALRLGTVSPVLRWHAAEVTAAAGDEAAAGEHLALVLRGAPWAPGVDSSAVVALADRLGVELPPMWASARGAGA